MQGPFSVLVARQMQVTGVYTAFHVYILFFVVHVVIVLCRHAIIRFVSSPYYNRRIKEFNNRRI